VDCKLGDGVVVLGARAALAGGLEAAAWDQNLAFGYASLERLPVAIEVDAQTWKTVREAQAKEPGNFRRVFPVRRGQDLAVLADARPVEGDELKERTVVPAGLPFDIGSSGDRLVWSRRGMGSTKGLWPLPSNPSGASASANAVADALRTAPFGDGRRIVAARMGNRLLLGTLATTGDPLPQRALEVIESPGVTLGAPAVAATGDTVLVAQAERSTPNDLWHLRLVRWHPGMSAPEVLPFKLPSGGLGLHAMAPSLAPLPWGGFLLAWTEGPVANHQVRAQVLTKDGELQGPPLNVSGMGVNAGQGAIAMGPNGLGGVAYFEAMGDMFRVVGVPIRCEGAHP
jgi:hypothetical protein